MTEAWDLVSNSTKIVPLIIFIGLMSKSYSCMHMIHLDHLLCSSVWFKVVSKERCRHKDLKFVALDVVLK
jgi:hypothetical protein